MKMKINHQWFLYIQKTHEGEYFCKYRDIITFIKNIKYDFKYMKGNKNTNNELYFLYLE